MYQTRLVKVDLSLRVPLALSRHSPRRSTFNLSLLHQAIFSFLFFFPTDSPREKFLLSREGKRRISRKKLSREIPCLRTSVKKSDDEIIRAIS